MDEAKEEGFPTDVEDKEAYFMNEVGQGEVLCQDSMFDAESLTVRALANRCTRFEASGGSPLLLQSSQGLPSAERPDFDLRQDSAETSD